VSQKAIANARRLEDTARELQRAGKFREAEEPLLGAIAIWKLARGPNDIEVLNDEIALAASFRRRGDTELAIATLERVMSEAVKSFADAEWNHVYRLALNNIGVAYREAELLNKARAALELALTLVDQVAVEAPEDLALEKARVLDNLASVLTLEGDHEGAERRARESLALWVELRGVDDVDTAVATANVGAAVMRQGRLDEARASLQASQRLLEQLLGASHPRLADGWLMMGELEVRAGDGEAASRAFGRCLDIARASGLPDHHPTVVRAQEFLAIAAPTASS